ncbi:hypothetical protein THASP1DRAFT_25017 [Thamnocephalis sphaerospora]|uniref:Uncharacterized protein n=1 Tax=Thamnocephalis sphaerospora TaxID=78915 RepID=A0A4P9XN40_9FUNG|nr:hypothetical protein THASP1DRAFT_25017 [Thamnocephalis sphaerospora]|eukprot:RKP06720.1 hypothetical protein THASP1DRAFT_25017 [Thamnocephalis sphaerospora]
MKKKKKKAKKKTTMVVMPSRPRRRNMRHSQASVGRSVGLAVPVSAQTKEGQLPRVRAFAENAASKLRSPLYMANHKSRVPPPSQVDRTETRRGKVCQAWVNGDRMAAGKDGSSSSVSKAAVKQKGEGTLDKRTRVRCRTNIDGSAVTAVVVADGTSVAEDNGVAASGKGQKRPWLRSWQVAATSVAAATVAKRDGGGRNDGRDGDGDASEVVCRLSAWIYGAAPRHGIATARGSIALQEAAEAGDDGAHCTPPMGLQECGGGGRQADKRMGGRMGGASAWRRSGGCDAHRQQRVRHLSYAVPCSIVPCTCNAYVDRSAIDTARHLRLSRSAERNGM